MDSSNRGDLSMAICTQSISHFEAPMFKLASELPGLRLKVFYLDEVEIAPKFDRAYGESIHWGGNPLDGYESVRCNSVREMKVGVEAWKAEVVLMYGYAWPGAASIILSRWIGRKPQIHRGTLSYHYDPRGSRLRSRMMRPLRNWLLTRFHAHHYGGSYSRKVLLDAGVDQDSLFFVPYSVDSGFFSTRSGHPASIMQAERIRDQAGWRSSDRVLLFIAQHNWVKGPDIMMEVFRKYRQTDDSARLLVVGSGSMTEEMEAYAQHHGFRQSVFFAGFVPSAETVPYYLASDLVVCTSRYETWARMVNEAMLCGKSCLINDAVAAAGGLVEDGVNGHVVRGLELDGYVQAITGHFAMDADQRARMSEEARTAARRFSYEENIHNVLDAALYAVRSTGK